MNAHWPKHKVYHTVAKQTAMKVREGGQLERTRLLAEEVARRAERTGDEIEKRFAAALALMAEGDNLHAVAKAWRKIIKEWPDEPTPYFNLAIALDSSDRNVESAPMFLKAMELYEDDTEYWARAAAKAFDLLKTDACLDMPKPQWWNDEALKALSARVVAVAPEKLHPCAMRARVLSGGALSGKAPWNAGPRTAAEIKEAAAWYRRTAMVTDTPAEKLRFEHHAGQCDEVADPLLAKEEAEAAKARAAAKAEAAKALKVAEAKATAAAKELLAEEEKEKHQAANKTAGKAKEGKGKKSKGSR